MNSYLNAILLSPLTWLVFAVGLIFGSFFNVCIYRIPLGTFWQKSRSACPHCGAAIPFYHNLPVISFLFLRGRAACCGKRISWQYPAVELLTATLFVFCYWKFPFIENYAEALQFDHGNILRFSHAAILTSLLIICSVIDLNHMIIPDVISLPMIALTPLVVYLHPELRWLDALIGVAAGGGILYGFAWVYWFIRKEVGMGMGDVKLLAGIGGWLGYKSVLYSLFYGAVIGSIIGIGLMVVSRQVNLKTAIPFGPMLALGALLYFFFGDYMIYL